MCPVPRKGVIAVSNNEKPKTRPESLKGVFEHRISWVKDERRNQTIEEGTRDKGTEGRNAREREREGGELRG